MFLNTIGKVQLSEILVVYIEKQTGNYTQEEITNQLEKIVDKKNITNKFGS